MTSKEIAERVSFAAEALIRSGAIAFADVDSQAQREVMRSIALQIAALHSMRELPVDMQIVCRELAANIFREFVQHSAGDDVGTVSSGSSG